jgi:hypothetical protein
MHAGLLPKPPFWDFHRLGYPHKPCELPEKMTPIMIRCLNVTPKSVVLTPSCSILGVEEVVVDFVDLVEADDSGDEEGICRRQQVNRKLVFDPEALPLTNGTVGSDTPALDSAEVVPPVENSEAGAHPSTEDTKTNVAVISENLEETVPKKTIRSSQGQETMRLSRARLM